MEIILLIVSLVMLMLGVYCYVQNTKKRSRDFKGYIKGSFAIVSPSERNRLFYINKWRLRFETLLVTYSIYVLIWSLFLHTDLSYVSAIVNFIIIVAFLTLATNIKKIFNYTLKDNQHPTNKSYNSMYLQ